MYCSDAKQDIFVDVILKKNDGIYLDVGSAHSQFSNNTFFLSKYKNWKGICIEVNSKFYDSYKNRNNCTFINQNAIGIDYKKLFNNLNYLYLDYLSLDIDELSLDVLKALPLDIIRSKVITIEHDFYLHGDKYRQAQRNILQNFGYKLLFGDIFVEPVNRASDLSFEDWYVDRDVIPEYIFNMVQSNGISPTNAILKLMEKFP